MEQQIEQVVTLLEEKRFLFKEYETITDALSEAGEIEVMEDYITQRSVLANKIDKLDDKIKKLLDEPIGSEIKRAMSPSSLRESLPEGLWQVYDSNLCVLDIVRRIRLKNADITADYQRLRQELSDKIKASSNMPKINKYLNNLSSPSEINNFGSV